MKIHHISHISNPNSIVVRNYDNRSIVHYPSEEVKNFKDKLDDELGQWRFKIGVNLVPKEYCEIIEFEKL